MLARRVLLLVALSAPSGCRRETPVPLTLTIRTFDHPPDGGAGAVPVGEKRTSEPGRVAVVTEAMRVARATRPLIRCTFLEGGDPVGLRFELSDKQRIYLRGVRATAMLTDGCYEVPDESLPPLRSLATALGARDPSLAP